MTARQVASIFAMSVALAAFAMIGAIVIGVVRRKGASDFRCDWRN